MVIPLSSIIRVSANAYTILQVTFEQVFLRGSGEDWFCGFAHGRSRDSGILVLGDTIPSRHAAADIQSPQLTTTVISIPSVATAAVNWTSSTPCNKVPSITASPPPTSVLLVSENGNGLNVSVSVSVASAASQTSSSLNALWAGSSLASASTYSPYLLRRAEPTTLGLSSATNLPTPSPFQSLTPPSEPFSSPNSDFSSPLSSLSTRLSTGTGSNGVTPTSTSTDGSAALSASSEMSSSTDLTSLSDSGFPTIITVLPSATSLSSDPDESDTATTTFVIPTPSSSIFPSTSFLPSFTTLTSSTISRASTDVASSSGSGTDASITFSEASSVVSTSTMDSTSSVSTTTGDSTTTSVSTTNSTDAGTSTSTGFGTSSSVTSTDTIPTSTSSEFTFTPTSSSSISTSGTSSGPQTTNDFPSPSLPSSVSGTQLGTVFSGTEPSSTSFPFLTSRSSRHMSATVIMSSTITVRGQSSSSALETITTTFVTSRAGGTPMTITSVVVGPSGSLNDGASSKRSMSAGAIAGLAVVSALAVLTVALWIWFAVRRRRRRYAHRNTHYSVGGRNSSYSPDGSGGPGMRSLRSSTALGSGYGVPGRGRNNSSGLLPIRISPLQGEDDDDVDAMHSSSAHSGPGSLEAGMMTQVNPIAVAHPSNPIGYPILPGWRIADRNRTNFGDTVADRLRGGAGSAAGENERVRDGTGDREWARKLLDAAGIGSPAAVSSTTSRPGPSGSHGRNPKRASFVLDSLPPAPRARSASPPELMAGVGTAVARSTLLPSRSEIFDANLSSLRDTRGATIARNNSNSAFQRRSLPPSAWPVIDTSRSMSKGKEKDDSSSPVRANEPNTETFGRVRSHSGSAELSSSGHGHGQSGRVVTSSQGHGSATASGENEGTSSSGSGSGSTGSHQGGTGTATQSQSLMYTRKQSKRRSNSMDGGFFSRAASLARGSLRTNQRRPSSSGIMFNDMEVTVKRPPSPVSRLVPSVPLSPSVSTLTSNTPAIGAIIPPSPSPAPSRVPSALLRQQSPGPISLPPRSPSALMMMHSSGTGMRDSGVGLPVILATPSPLPTPDFVHHSHEHHVPDGRLDPRLAARLQEIHNVQSSMSTVGLKDNEDYSRPILPLVKNRDARDSMTSASSEYSQPSRPDIDDDRTPTQPNMRM
ncbi:hypothetical protein ACEPAG_2391 [Sanghuangporus baumii]